MGLWRHYIYSKPSDSGYWAAASKFADTTVVVSASDTNQEHTTVSLVWGRDSPAGVRSDDVMVCTLGMWLLPAGGDPTALADADKAAVEGLLNTWWGTIKGTLNGAIKLNEYRWHDYHGGATRPGPATRVTSVNVSATGGGIRMPDQVSATHTFRTASRRHWGRIYVPGGDTSQLGSYGLWANGTCDLWAGATHTLLNGAIGLATPVTIGVVSREHGGLLEISQLEVDNVADIQRRRRANARSYAKIYTS